MIVWQAFCTDCKRSWDSDKESAVCPYCKSVWLIRVEYERNKKRGNSDGIPRKQSKVD